MLLSRPSTSRPRRAARWPRWSAPAPWPWSPGRPRRRHRRAGRAGPLDRCGRGRRDCPAGYTSYADFLAQEQRLAGRGERRRRRAAPRSPTRSRWRRRAAASRSRPAPASTASTPSRCRSSTFRSLAQALPRVAPVGAVQPGAFGAALKQKGADEARLGRRHRRHGEAVRRGPPGRRRPRLPRRSTGSAWPTTPRASTSSPTTPPAAGCSPPWAAPACTCRPTSACTGAR